MTGEVLYERWRDNHTSDCDSWLNINQSDRDAWELLATEVNRYFETDDD